MPEINLQGAFSFLDSLKKIAVVSLIALIGFTTYIFKDDISNRINPEIKLLLKLEETVQLTDDDIKAVGYWKLNKETNHWECIKSLSVHEYDFCKQTGSFYNSPFVQQFQIKLENQDTIIVEVNPSSPTFEKFWRGTYTTIFGFDESQWNNKSFYVIYFQVGDTDDTRRVLYTLDKNDAVEGRVFTTHYKELILKEIE